MLQKMTKTGKIFFFISLISVLYAAFLVYAKMTGVAIKDYGDWLFLYYTIQVIVLVVPVGLHVFQGWMNEEDLRAVTTAAFANIMIYSVISICFGLFYTYVADMAAMMADILNGVFLVCVIFWYRQMMG
ncbi:hypothetical protein ACH52_2040 [Eubacterium limosum]|nr:hypothetical protein ACH52_2040 [Eubacterium limosum]